MIILFGLGALVAIIAGLAADIPAIAMLGVALAVIGIVLALRQRRVTPTQRR
jgi:hypothetical protein